jgi:hypothetical protein
VLHLPGLRLQMLTTKDRGMVLAAASDPQAQRWLGWRPEHVVPDGRREHLLVGRPRGAGSCRGRAKTGSGT